MVGLDHVQIAAPSGCEPAARAFFGALLGLRELEKPAALRASGGAWFELGAQELHIGVEADFAPARKAHPAFLVRADSLRELAERLRDGGAPVQWDERIPGRERLYTCDPWGNRLELCAAAPQPSSR